LSGERTPKARRRRNGERRSESEHGIGLIGRRGVPGALGLPQHAVRIESPKAATARALRASKGPLTVAALAEALRTARGVRTLAAETLGIPTARLSRAVARSKTLQDLEAELKRANRDRAEAALLESIAQGKIPAILFYLRQRQANGMEHDKKDDGVEDRLDLSALTDQELEELERLIAKASRVQRAVRKRRPRAHPGRAGAA